MSENNPTVIYYTSNTISDYFAKNTREQLLKAIGDLPLISVSQVPMKFGDNISIGDIGRSHLNIYRQALIGAQAANTKYIFLCEDDVLYSPEHFKYRPSPGKFAYNLANWAVYTWKPDVFSWKGRRNLYALICERDLFLEAIGERFSKWTNDDDIDISLWAEPGKYERQLGVTVRETETFWTHPPNIAFSHEQALSYDNLGKRKRLGELRATELPVWGRIEEVYRKYKDE